MNKEIIITIFNRKIIEAEALKEFFRQMKDGRHMIIHKDCRKRSLSQNAYYWGVVVPYIQKGLFDIGYDDVTDNETAHDVIKTLFLQKIIANKKDGDTIYLQGSTKKLNIPEFNEFIERVIKWASEFLGIVIPSPENELSYFSDWAENQSDIVEDFN